MQLGLGDTDRDDSWGYAIDDVNDDRFLRHHFYLFITGDSDRPGCTDVRKRK